MQGVPQERQSHFVYTGSTRRACSKPSKPSADQTPGTPPIASISSARLPKHASHMRTPNGLSNSHHANAVSSRQRQVVRSSVPHTGRCYVGCCQCISMRTEQELQARMSHEHAYQ